MIKNRRIGPILFVVAALIVGIPCTASANDVFEFVAVEFFNHEFLGIETGDTIATLELSSLPATHEQFAELVFTPIGQAATGLPEVYPGTFDTIFDGSNSSATIDQNQDGELICVECPSDDGAFVTDLDPPAGGYTRFNLGFGGDGALDVIIAFGGAVPELDSGIAGNWLPVIIPEPSALLLFSVASFAVVFLPRKVNQT